VQKRFEFFPPITDELREIRKSDLNEKWRQWKGDLKAAGFDSSKTVNEIVSKLSYVMLGLTKLNIVGWLNIGSLMKQK
jgi:hypothetical protein